MSLSSFMWLIKYLATVLLFGKTLCYLYPVSILLRPVSDVIVDAIPK